MYLNYNFTLNNKIIVIGFIGAPYSTNESDRVLSVQVGVLSGILETETVVTISTRDLTAIGKRIALQ